MLVARIRAKDGDGHARSFLDPEHNDVAALDVVELAEHIAVEGLDRELVHTALVGHSAHDRVRLCHAILDRTSKEENVGLHVAVR